MYRKTVAEIDGKRATIGNNGDIVEVVRKTAAGLVLRNARGQTAEIDWRRLSDPKTGRLLLGFGHAFTIDAAQGMSTKGEHINALPHGTGATSAFKTYTAESRATGRTHTLISKVAVHAAVQRSRALGDVTPVTEGDLWKEVAKDASEKPYKALALDIAGKARRQHDRAVEIGLSNHNRIEKVAEERPDLRGEMKAAYQAGLLRQAFEQQRDTLLALMQTIDEQLKRAAGVLVDHARAMATAIKGAPVAGPEAPDRPEPPAPAPSARPKPLGRPLWRKGSCRNHSFYVRFAQIAEHAAPPLRGCRTAASFARSVLPNPQEPAPQIIRSPLPRPRRPAAVVICEKAELPRARVSFGRASMFILVVNVAGKCRRGTNREAQG